MLLGQKLKKGGFRISISKKGSHKRNGELDLFAKCLRQELEKRGPTPQSILYEEAKEYVFSQQKGHAYLGTKLEQYFFGRLDGCPYGIRRIKLKQAVSKYIDPLCTHLTIAHAQVSPLEHILYLSESSLRRYLKHAYRGKETRTYVHLDFSKTL